jgi:hypothetical protein
VHLRRYVCVCLSVREKSSLTSYNFPMYLSWCLLLVPNCEGSVSGSYGGLTLWVRETGPSNAPILVTPDLEDL